MAGKGIDPDEVTGKNSYFADSRSSTIRLTRFLPPTKKAIGGWSVTARTIGDPRFPYWYHRLNASAPPSRAASDANTPKSQPERITDSDLHHWMDRNASSVMLIGARDAGNKRMPKEVFYRPGKERPPKVKPAQATRGVSTTPMVLTPRRPVTAQPLPQQVGPVASAAIDFLNSNERAVAGARSSLSRGSSRPKTAPAQPPPRPVPPKRVLGGSLLVPSMVEFKKISMEDLVQSLRSQPDWLPKTATEDDTMSIKMGEEGVGEVEAAQTLEAHAAEREGRASQEVERRAGDRTGSGGASSVNAAETAHLHARARSPARKVQAPAPPPKKDAWGLVTDTSREGRDAMGRPMQNAGMLRKLADVAREEGARARTFAIKFGMREEDVMGLWGRFNAIDSNLDRFVSWQEYHLVRGGIPFQARREIEKAFAKCPAGHQALSFEQFLCAVAPLYRRGNASKRKHPPQQRVSAAP